eukprot:7713312-Heterocapsa_arctica.AAC.1
MSLYGTRDAAQNWGEELWDTLKKLGFVKGKASSSLFHLPRRQLKAAVHGDDITVKGWRARVEAFMGEFAK